jgi:phage-related protein
MQDNFKREYIQVLGFFHEGNFIVLTNGFIKKTQKTPKEEITICETRMKDFIVRGGDK